jgi:type III pantothenate kinase
MYLAVDIGNTRTKIGLFDAGRQLIEKLVWNDWDSAQLHALALHAGVEKIILSSVARETGELHEYLGEHFLTVQLDHNTPLPFRNTYATPHTLGKDRLAATAGAQALYPGRHCLVVDCGTCIKYELLSAEGVYLGGNIAPGAVMRLQAMHHFTARLPQAPLEMPQETLGNSTTSALQNGALRGAALEIEGFSALYRQRFSPLHVILSGGDADFFKPHLHLEHCTVEPDLTLHGLNHILHHLYHA